MDQINEIDRTDQIDQRNQMSFQHADLAAGRWQTVTLVEQLANVDSDVSRAH